MLIRSVMQFFGPEGEVLEELTLCDADTGLPPTPEQLAEIKEPEPLIVYLGVIQIPVAVSIPGPDGKPMMIDVRPQEMRFPINVSSRREAFESFAEKAQEVYAELKKRQEERTTKKSSGLIIPNAAQSEAINKLKLTD